jgi:ubiquinone biosynthesis protein UbiJ
MEDKKMFNKGEHLLEVEDQMLIEPVAIETLNNMINHILSSSNSNKECLVREVNKEIVTLKITPINNNLTIQLDRDLKELEGMFKVI